MTTKKEKPTVVVTGFGPFRGYTANPSWEAVKLLQMDNFTLIKKQIPVDYNLVDVDIPNLWRTYDPLLVVHCGVSRFARGLVFEKKAFGSEYRQCDINGCLPKCTTENSGNCECLTTGLNVESVCEKVNKFYDSGKIKLKAEPSSDAGRYLCEYIYYTSLKENPARTIFIHVPELGNSYTAQDISDGIKCAIQVIVDDMV